MIRLLVVFALVIWSGAVGLSYLLEWRDDIRRGAP